MSNAPTIAANRTDLYSSYWKSAPNKSNVVNTYVNTFEVFSARRGDLEAGFAPFLEGKFATLEQANDYAAAWNELSDNVEFWVGDSVL